MAHRIDVIGSSGRSADRLRAGSATRQAGRRATTRSWPWWPISDRSGQRPSNSPTAAPTPTPKRQRAAKAASSQNGANSSQTSLSLAHAVFPGLLRSGHSLVTLKRARHLVLPWQATANGESSHGEISCPGRRPSRHRRLRRHLGPARRHRRRHRCRIGRPDRRPDAARRRCRAFWSAVRSAPVSAPRRHRSADRRYSLRGAPGDARPCPWAACR